MVVTVLPLGAVGLVWYSLSWLSVLSNVFQIDGQEWLLYTLGISSWVSCMGPPCVSWVVIRSVSDPLCVVIRDVELLFLYSSIHCVYQSLCTFAIVKILGSQ